MQLQRIKRSRNENFTTINNAVVLDRELSLKAKGLMLTIMSLPDTCDFSINGLVSIINESENTIYGIINELIEAGYVKRERIYIKGKIAHWEYVFFEERQQTQGPDLLPKNLEIENLEQENRTQLKTYSNKDLKNQETHTHIPATAAFEYPLRDLIDAFPDINLMPGQAGMIEATVTDSDLHRRAWAATIEIYRGNHDRAMGRYLPEKVGNLLSVFKAQCQELERQTNGKANNKRKPTPAEIIASRPYRQNLTDR